MQGKNKNLLEIYSSPELEFKEDYNSAAEDLNIAAGNTPFKNTAGNIPLENITRNMPFKNAAKNIPPFKNAARNISSSINLTRNISPKKCKLGEDTKTRGKSENNILLDLN